MSLQQVIEQVGQEKGIDTKILVEATEEAILAAAKRTFGMTRELEARFNEATGSVDLFQYMTVVEEVDDEEREISMVDAQRYGLEASEGEELGFQIFYMPEDMAKARAQDEEFGDLLGIKQQRQNFGRIAAQTAKQVIVQRVRDAERDRVYAEYKDRLGEIFSGVVRRFERGSTVVVDIGRGVEAQLPMREQVPREGYRPGDRVVAVLKRIDREARGQQLVLSRSDSGLLVKLFETEVPEIYEGIVRIVAAAREAGARSKIAVASRDSDVDPVGACVGMKGSRVQAVVQELRGEKIDIVPWDRDPARFVCNAIAPAEVMRVVIDDVHQSMELVVPDAKLSLAIGRRGQNVRLASQLTGWKLDIVGETRFRELEEAALARLESLVWEDDRLAKELYRLGFRTLDELLDASDDELASVPGVGEGKVAALRQSAEGALDALRLERLERARTVYEPLTGRDRLLMVAGIGERLATVLEHGGFGSPESLRDTKDVDRIALQAGIDSSRAQTLQASASAFLANEWPSIDAARKVLAVAARAEAERVAKLEAIAEAEAAADAALRAESAATASDAADVPLPEQESGASGSAEPNGSSGEDRRPGGAQLGSADPAGLNAADDAADGSHASSSEERHEPAPAPRV